MKTLIVYKSKHGSTQKASNYLRERLGVQNADLMELNFRSNIDFSAYESILIGGSIHAGSIQRTIKKFCQNHLPELLKKKIGLFLCYMDKANGIKEFNEAYPEQLRQHALAKGLFGGEFLFEKMNFVERFIIKKISGVTRTKHNLDYDAMDAFADIIKES